MDTANGFLSAPCTDSNARRISTYGSVPGSNSRTWPSSSTSPAALPHEIESALLHRQLSWQVADELLDEHGVL